MSLDKFSIVINEAKKRAKRFEGFSATVYRCPANRLTIGYGLNLERDFYPPATLTELGTALVLSQQSGLAIGPDWKGLQIDEERAGRMLQVELVETYRELANAVEYYDTLHPNAQVVLLDMVYNMGLPSLMQFKKMWAAIHRGDWIEASEQILDSKYHRDTGKRAEENAAMIGNLKQTDLSLEQRVVKAERDFEKLQLAHMGLYQ